MSNMLKFVPGPLKFAVIAALIPFFGSFYLSQNGVYRDYVAIGAGGLAILLAFVSLLSLNSSENKGLFLGITVATLALAAFQLARGFGVF